HIYMPFGAVDSSVTVSNGGLIESVGGDLAEFEDGAIFVGLFAADTALNASLDVTGEGSTVQAQHSFTVGNQFGQAVVNVTDGGTVRQLEAGIGSIGVLIDSFDADGARVVVSGVSGGSVESSLEAATDIHVGSARGIVGFTAGGDAR